MPISRYRELSDQVNGQVDCANCLMPLQVEDVIEHYQSGAMVGEEVVYSHLATGDIYCEDQAPPYNTAEPRNEWAR